jgi:hypothetical protein
MDNNRTNVRTELLAEAETLVNGERDNQYGDPRDDFRKTAGMWDIYLKAVYKERSTLLPHDVAALLCMLKISRIAWSPDKRDNWVDLAGYAACGWDCAEHSYK